MKADILKKKPTNCFHSLWVEKHNIKDRSHSAQVDMLDGKTA